MTETGGTGNTAGSGNRPDQGAPGSEPTPGSLPQWQPFAAPPQAPTSATPPPPAPMASLPPANGVAPPQSPPQGPAGVPSSAWITTAPQAPPKRGIGGNLAGIIGAVVGIVIVGGVVAGALGLLPSDKGKVLFGTAAGSDLCSVGNATTTFKTSDPIFFAAVLKHHMDGAQAITLTITRDGQPFVDHDEPADGTSFDCYGSRDSVGSFEAGSYVFTVTHNSEVEATGTLTVQP